MKIFSVYSTIGKLVSYVKKPHKTDVHCAVETGKRALECNKQVSVCNQVEPLKNDFKSTKELFSYAKARCIESQSCKNPYEHTVVANIKTNRILAEYKGEENSCRLPNLNDLPLDDKNVVLIHSHTEGYPISPPDVRVLLNNEINQVIAVTPKGEFSLVAKRTGIIPAKIKSAPFKKFDYECMDNTDCYLDTRNVKMLQDMTHSTMKSHSKNLGISYITNYSQYKGK